jgi:hypothetical protein
MGSIVVDSGVESVLPEAIKRVNKLEPTSFVCADSSEEAVAIVYSRNIIITIAESPGL